MPADLLSNNNVLGRAGRCYGGLVALRRYQLNDSGATCLSSHQLGTSKAHLRCDWCQPFAGLDEGHYLGLCYAALLQDKLLPCARCSAGSHNLKREVEVLYGDSTHFDYNVPNTC